MNNNNHVLKRVMMAVVTIGCFQTATVLHAQTGSSYRHKQIPFPLILENKAELAFVSDERIILVAGSKTDMFRDPNVTYNTDNAPKLLFRPDADFVFSTSIEHAFANKWDAGAIVLKQDSLNWVKFCFERDYTGANRVVSVVTKDISDDCNSVEIKSNKVYFKIAKADNVITLYYSEDNKRWMLVRHFQFNTTKPLQLGLLAQSPTGDSCKVVFGDIIYQNKKIKDPYSGE